MDSYFSWPSRFLFLVFGSSLVSGLLLPLNTGLSRPSNISSSSNGLPSIFGSPSSNSSLLNSVFDSNSAFLRNVTSEAAPIRPICNGEMFGTLLDRDSCYEAVKLIASDTQPLTWGDRGQRSNVLLPRRYSSSDGRCVIDVYHKNGVVSDIANSRDIRYAALAILGECMQPSHDWSGGYVRDIGKSKNLVVVITPFKPDVSCFGRIQSNREVEQSLLDNIPSDFKQRNFGPFRAPGVDEALPKFFSPVPRVPPPYDIYAKVVAQDQSVVQARWFDIWTNAVAIAAMCIRRFSMTGYADVGNGLRVVLIPDHRNKRPSNSTALFGVDDAIDVA